VDSVESQSRGNATASIPVAPDSHLLCWEPHSALHSLVTESSSDPASNERTGKCLLAPSPDTVERATSALRRHMSQLIGYVLRYTRIRPGPLPSYHSSRPDSDRTPYKILTDPECDSNKAFNSVSFLRLI